MSVVACVYLFHEPKFLQQPIPMLQRLDVKEQHIYRRRKNFPRSVFSPLVSAGQGDCVVSASEDGSVHFFQLTKQDRACINKLQVFNFFFVKSNLGLWSYYWVHQKLPQFYNTVFAYICIWKVA